MNSVRSFHSYNQFHLGDNLIHLHFLRRLALLYPHWEFIHAVHLCHMSQLQEAIADVPNVKLVDIEREDIKHTRWGNVWKNAGATVVLQGAAQAGFHNKYVPGFWEQHPLRNDYAGFYLAWFEYLAVGMGLNDSPFKKPTDLLFDYPKIQEPTPLSGPFDFLIINSRPCSGQARGYDRVDYFDPLIEKLIGRYRVIVTQRTNLPVPCTADYGLTISQVGNLSLSCPYILMVSTGPSWPTFNIWNRETVKLRLVMLEREQLNLAPNTIQVQRLEQMTAILRERKLI